MTRSQYESSSLARRSGAPFFPALGVAATVMMILCGVVSVRAIGFGIGTNFSDGNFSASGFIPPDTMGAVGPNHIAVMINGVYRVYNKSGVQQQTKSLDSFWTSAGVTPSGSFSYDPRILYDAASGRWFASSVDNSGGANNFLVAVSATDNPTGAWTGFKIDADTDNGQWADFPTLGINNSVLTISANMFPISSGSTSTSQLVIPKADLLLGSPTVANRTLFENTSSTNTGFSIQPAVDLTGGGLPLPLLSSYSKSSGSLKISTIGGTPSAPTLNTSGGFITVTARGTPPTIDQPGSKVNIDASDSRFSGSAIIQQTPGRADKSIWAVQSVNVSNRAAIEWYEINASTNAIFQSGVISDPVLAFNYPSISVNPNGVVVVGFSGGSPNTFMSTYVALGETISGVTSFSSIVQTKAGVSDYQRLDSSGRNRWGDYSSTVLDPVNSSAFWTFQEFASGTDQWQVQVTQILVPEPSVLALVACVFIGLGCRRFTRRTVCAHVAARS